MKLVDEHILKHLDGFIPIPDHDFKLIFDVISHQNKSRYQNLLLYLDRVINSLINLNNSGLQYSHLHLVGMDDVEGRHVIGEFIGVKFFLTGLKTAKQPSIDNTLEKEVKRLSMKLKYFPEGVTGKSKESKQILARRKLVRRIIEYYRNIQTIYPDRQVEEQTLMNVSQAHSQYLNEICEGDHFILPIDHVRSRKSFVYTNSVKSRDQLDSIKINDSHLLDLLQHIVLFDCEEKQVHRQFNYKELDEWNNQSSSFKNLIIISFGDHFRFCQLKSRIERIQSRFHSKEPKFPDYQSYVISQPEIKKLIGDQNEESNDEIIFFDQPNLEFWDDVKTTLSLHNGLYELRSINMLNLYSMVVNDGMKNVLLSSIFDSTDALWLIGYETQSAIKELSTTSINDLKRCLSLLFDWIIQSNWRKEIISKVKQATVVVLPYQLVNNRDLLDNFCKDVGLTKLQKVITWKQFSEYPDERCLILAYRDAGQFPYRITPNLFEIRGTKFQVTALFLSFFFHRKFKWTDYSMSRDYAKILSNETRAAHFSWKDLLQEIVDTKPEKVTDIDWDFENSYSPVGDHLTIKVKFRSVSKPKSYYPSEWFIVKYSDSPSLRVVHLDDLSNEDFSESPIMGQCLDEIHAEFNLYEKLANVDREEAELKLIRNKYNLNGTQSASSLWKVLLKRKAVDTFLYKQLESYLGELGLRLVSQNTFETNWLDDESNTLIPRENKVFLSLCQFLELPMTYYRLMLRKKNAERQERRKNTKQMSDLLSDLINDGCFNDGANYLQIIANNKDKYIRNHDFDEIGVSKEQVEDELQTLVNLLLPCLKLLSIESIEI